MESQILNTSAFCRVNTVLTRLYTCGCWIRGRNCMARSDKMLSNCLVGDNTVNLTLSDCKNYQIAGVTTHNARGETEMLPQQEKKKKKNPQPACWLSHNCLTTRSDVIHRLVKSTIAAQYALFFPNERIWQQPQRRTHLKTSLLTRFHLPTIGGHFFKRLLVSLGLLHLQSGPLHNRRRDGGDV